MLDLIIRNGTVVDGTGAPGRRADVGIRNGRIAAIGEIDDEAATRTIDADGKVVAPGFVDIHTHYDAQVFWDTTLSPSPLHGVTTVIGGNCGFTIAPLAPEHGDYLHAHARPRRGHAASARSPKACRGTGRAFGEYLDRIDGTLAPNAGFLVGHSTIRRVVMGERATQGDATADDLAAMQRAARREPRRGRHGLLVELGAHAQRRRGRHGAVALRDEDEILALCRVVREHPGTTLEFIPCVGLFEDYAPDLMTRMSLAANRPINWNVLFVGKGSERDHRAQPRRVRLRDRARRPRARADDARSRRRRASASTAASCSTRSRAGRSRWRSPTTRRRRCSPSPDGREPDARPLQTERPASRSRTGRST